MKQGKLLCDNLFYETDYFNVRSKNLACIFLLDINAYHGSFGGPKKDLFI